MPVRYCIAALAHLDQAHRAHPVKRNRQTLKRNSTRSHDLRRTSRTLAQNYRATVRERRSRSMCDWISSSEEYRALIADHQRLSATDFGP